MNTTATDPAGGPTALTHSSWINAWSLRRACAALGVRLATTDGSHGMPLPAYRPGTPVDWEFMTEEAALKRALEGGAKGRFWPSRFPPGLLDDKWAFAQWLAQRPDGPQPLRQWPLEAAAVEWPVLLKARHSWVDGRKLPRGWVCRDAQHLERAIVALAPQRLQADWFFLQQWLGDRPMRLLSVVGFFDADDEARNLLLVTERVEADGPDGPRSSAMLVTVPGRGDLCAACAAVLKRLGYRGPFEMEFIEANGECRVLELNPRFWMQHGVFEALGDGVVKRYLERDGPDDRGRHDPADPPPLLWVDGAWWLRRCLRLDTRAWAALRRYGRGRRAMICPPPWVLVLAALRRWAGVGRRPEKRNG